MPSLLSGSTLRRGGSGEFIDLAGAQPQLPATETTLTGFTLVTNELLQTSYKSSLGFIEIHSATMWSSLPAGSIRILNTGNNTISVDTATGLLVVEGDIGVGGRMNIKKDIVVNGLTIGRGYEGVNNIVFRGTASAHLNSFEDGKASIAIGYDTLLGLATSYKSLAIGRYALSSGTNLSNNIAIGDSSLKMVGVFTSTGTLNDSNVAVGVDSGVALVSGQQNVFIGHQAANLLTTGSYNIIIGPLTGQYLYTGSGIISIGGDNIVDGLDDQVNIGSVFYYDGTGYSYINADNTVGLGTTAEILSTGTFTSSSTVTGGLVVVGGIFGWDNLILADTFKILGTGTSTIAGPLVPGGNNATLGTAAHPFSSIYLQGSTIYLGTVTIKSYNSQAIAIESPAGYVTATIGNLYLDSGDLSTDYTNGSLVVDGGVGIAGGLFVGGNGDVDLSPTAKDVTIKPTAGGLVDIRPNATGNIDNMVIGANDSADATFDNIYSSSVGIAAESNLVYTPRISITTGTPPVSPRIGDIWIDSSLPAYLQYIKDGTSTFWIQVGAV